MKNISCKCGDKISIEGSSFGDVKKAGWDMAWDCSNGLEASYICPACTFTVRGLLEELQTYFTPPIRNMNFIPLMPVPKE